MNKLLERMMKSGSIKQAAILEDSAFFNAKDTIPTDLPILNIAFTGKLNGGLIPGLTVIAGVSKSFKTLLGLYCLKAYMDKYKDAVCLFYDSEFGVTPEYLKTNGIDTSRVLHIPIEHVEQLKFDIVKRLEEIKRGDKVFIFIDSVGNLASKKEVEDALEGKSVADMSRAKSIKSLFRIITPHLTTKDIPCVAINHVYAEMGLFPKNVMSGGCVVEGTEIQMYDGSLKEIQNIEVNDLVRTLEGAKPVSHIWNPETLENGNPECYEITFADGHTVVCSENHPFLTTKGWVEAKNLTEKHEIVSLEE
jgi:hypothetical protein